MDDDRLEPRVEASKTGRRLVVIILVLGMAVSVVGVFVIDTEHSGNEPVEFDETVSVGLTLEDEFRLEAEYDHIQFPQVQVFYSQYPFVVGYYGVERFVDMQRKPAHDRQFGYPMNVYVTVFDHGRFTVTDDGYPKLEGQVRWHPAEDVVYLVGSDARTPTGETVIPFADQSRAEAVAEEHGGEIRSWSAVLDQPHNIDDAATVRSHVERQHQNADDLVDRVRATSDRDDRLVVGEDGPTVQATIDAAPPNSTVVVPNGTYEETIQIDRPVTLLGESGSEIRGDKNGSVIQVAADHVALRSLAVTGVGNTTPVDAGTHDHDHGEQGNGEWDDNIEEVYARGDAGIISDDSEHILIERVAIESPASGIILRDSPHAVVSDVTVYGNPDPLDGHMGIVAMRSTGVIEESTFRDGRDAIYTHRADGIVVRNNSVADNRIGIHLMYTSDALLANNEITDQTSTGIFVMTGPARNSIVGNVISDSATGLDIGGSDSYIANNRVTRNEFGIRLDATSSIIERNLVVGNDYGILTRALLPTNTVVDNDFVDNERHTGEGAGPHRIWTDGDRGNYWEGAVGNTEGDVLDRPYTPTDPVDRTLHTVAGTRVLAHSPGMMAIAGLEDAVSGMQDGQIIDTAPRCEPVHTEWLEINGYPDLDPRCPDGSNRD